jgi:hypothetical protein
MPDSFGLLLSSTGLFYGLLIPLMLAQMIAVFVLVASSKSGARPSEVAKAVYCYLAETAGILLMSIGGITAMASVLSSRPLSSATYMGLLFVFAVGGITYLYHDGILHRVEASARSIPDAIFLYSWKFIALLVTLFAALSFILQLLLREGEMEPYWWVIHLVLVFYGVVLAWCVAHPLKDDRPQTFRSAPVARPAMSMAASAPKKAVTKKKR